MGMVDAAGGVRPPGTMKRDEGLRLENALLLYISRTPKGLTRNVGLRKIFARGHECRGPRPQVEPNSRRQSQTPEGSPGFPSAIRAAWIMLQTHFTCTAGEITTSTTANCLRGRIEIGCCQISPLKLDKVGYDEDKRLISSVQRYRIFQENLWMGFRVRHVLRFGHIAPHRKCVALAAMA